MADRPTLVVVGAASRDLDAADPRGWRLGGGVVYSSLAAARLGVSVRAVVGVDRAAATSHELELLSNAGVDVRPVPLEHGPAFDNRQTPSGRVQYAEGPSDPIAVENLPKDWSSPTAAILAPVAGEIHDEWSWAFHLRTIVALGAQGLVRRLVPGGQVTPVPLVRNQIVARAQLILLSAEDVASRTSPLHGLISVGQELVITHGPAGAVYLRYQANGVTGRYLPPTPRRDPVDTTGAGDVFLGAWVAAQAVIGNVKPWRPLLVAAAMASLSVRGRTLAEMPTASDLCEVLIKLRDQDSG